MIPLIDRGKGELHLAASGIAQETGVKPVAPDWSKKSRARAAEIPFEQGCVWHMDRDWVQPVIRECAQFPNGEYDDWVDTVTQTMIWLRKTYHLEFRDEEKPT